MQVTGPLVLKNGASTPADVSFFPQQVAPGLSVFADRGDGIHIAFKNITVEYSPASAKRGTDRVKIGIELPIAQVVDGITSVAHTSRVEITIVMPSVATQAQRSDVQAFAANLLNNNVIKALIKDLDPLY